MKKLLSVSVAALAFAAVADYTPITVGVTAVATDTKNTIVAVPYSAIGSNEAIAPNDLVKSANLPENTMLYVFNGTSYYAWKRSSAGTWVVPDLVGTETINGVDISAGTSTVKLNKGSALWVVLPNAESYSATIYVYGDGVSPATTSTVSAGANLVANPTASEANISVTPAVGDQVLVPSGDDVVRYTYKTSRSGTSAWRCDGAAVSLPSISAGKGIWYVRASGAADATITWTAKNN